MELGAKRDQYQDSVPGGDMSREQAELSSINKQGQDAENLHGHHLPSPWQGITVQLFTLSSNTTLLEMK